MFNPLQPLPQTSTAWGNQKKTQTCRFSLGKEREKWNIHPVSQLFRELSQGLVSVLSNLECWWSTPTYFGCLGTTENKELSGLLLHRWTCSTTNRHQREQKNKTLKKKKSKDKKLANLSNREMTYPRQPKMYPQKGWGPPNLYPGWQWRSSLYKVSTVWSQVTVSSNVQIPAKTNQTKPNPKTKKDI